MTSRCLSVTKLVCYYYVGEIEKPADDLETRCWKKLSFYNDGSQPLGIQTW